MIFRNDFVGGERNLHPSTHNQIAVRLNRDCYASDYAALQAAVDAAKVQTAAGGVVNLSPGVYTIDAPIILPRSVTVGLEGAGVRQTTIQGSANFPENRALIEWEATPTRVFHQAVRNLTLQLPNVAGVKAIHFKPTAKTTYNDHNAERLQIFLDNLRILGHNDYHEVLIYLEGTINRSLIRNIEGDPAAGNRTYNTLLLKTDTEILSDRGDDWIGFNPSCQIEHLYSNTTRGGCSRLIEARLNTSILRDCICDGGTETNFKLVNCVQSRFENLFTEGREEKPQYLFDRCGGLDVRNIGVGTPDEYYGTGLGNGIELVACTDCQFDGRFTSAGKPAFSGKGVKVISIDADCKRNTFRQWGIRSGGTPADEFSILGDNTNTIDYIDYATNTTGTVAGGA